ncbi:hypothetical protein ACL2XG_05400 [Sodalis sp. RH24]|uniref:hypothetical protein n=1 Tax=unclassified Sodalis (in: enterobacteria) TaxID=2636512 RepID=UPI0039B3FF36
MTVIIAWIFSHLSVIGAALVGLVGIIGTAFGLGHSKGKTTAETAAKVDKVETEKQAIQTIATKQAEVSEVAKNVQNENSNITDDAARERMRQSKYNSPD